jgi:hypothetical protein
MKLKIDREADALYLTLDESDIADSEEGAGLKNEKSRKEIMGVIGLLIIGGIYSGLSFYELQANQLSLPPAFAIIIGVPLAIGLSITIYWFKKRKSKSSTRTRS